MPPSLPELIDGKYRVLQKLGRGGMGAVYLVRESGSTSLFALKVLHEESLQNPSAVARFKAEMTLPEKIGSEYIVKVVASGAAPELDGAPYLVMELLRGCDLGRVLETLGRRSGSEVLWILHRIAQALDKAHAAGVVHRDLKPENIFLHMAGPNALTVKLLDFGIARITEDARQSIAAGRVGATTTTIGTPLYMAPEQAQGPSEHVAPVGPATDIWALGMIVYELLTGETYWKSDDGNALRILGQIVFTPQLEPPSRRSHLITKGLDAWFLRSCAHRAGERWPSAGEQISTLAHALDVRGLPSLPPKELVIAVQKLMPELPKEAYEQTLFLRDHELTEEAGLYLLPKSRPAGNLDGPTLLDSSPATVPFLKQPPSLGAVASAQPNTSLPKTVLTPPGDRRRSMDDLEVLPGLDTSNPSNTANISDANTLKRLNFLNIKVPWSDLGLLGWLYAVWKTPAYRRTALLSIILLAAFVAVLMIVLSPQQPSRPNPSSLVKPDLGTVRTPDAGHIANSQLPMDVNVPPSKPLAAEIKPKNPAVNPPKKLEKKTPKKPVLELPKD